MRGKNQPLFEHLEEIKTSFISCKSLFTSAPPDFLTFLWPCLNALARSGFLAFCIFQKLLAVCFDAMSVMNYLYYSLKHCQNIQAKQYWVSRSFLLKSFGNMQRFQEIPPLDMQIALPSGLAIMAIWVVEFSNRGYKIRNIFT